MFSIFKAKNNTENCYYMLLGNIRLDKHLIDNCYPSNIFAFLQSVNKVKTIPIGNYFVVVKFSPVKNFVRNFYDKNNNMVEHSKAFPTNILKVQYILNEQDIDNKFTLVNPSFEVF